MILIHNLSFRFKASISRLLTATEIDVFASHGPSQKSAFLFLK